MWAQGCRFLHPARTRVGVAGFRSFATPVLMSWHTAAVIVSPAGLTGSINSAAPLNLSFDVIAMALRWLQRTACAERLPIDSGLPGADCGVGFSATDDKSGECENLINREEVECPAT